ncbi:hypothetical protein CSOJ01_13267 [Colletotrichum sojae]|uniref:Uncharacterized protein n=1 Tax=Colletotrichum sojae TaxID=2175907 RepID=A0A8H6ITM7_9PEZI|nr:hypothetical protein CSOJ01_13267 [Colletotrichum sojae]
MSEYQFSKLASTRAAPPAQTLDTRVPDSPWGPSIHEKRGRERRKHQPHRISKAACFHSTRYTVNGWLLSLSLAAPGDSPAHFFLRFPSLVRRTPARPTLWKRRAPYRVGMCPRDAVHTPVITHHLPRPPPSPAGAAGAVGAAGATGATGATGVCIYDA